MEIRFSEILPGDLIEIRELQPEGWPDIVPEFEFYIRKGFCHPLKAIDKGSIVGAGASILFSRTAWLAHIIVRKEHRKRGIGYKITQKLLNDQRVRSTGTVLLIATEPGRPVYEKAGFQLTGARGTRMILGKDIGWKPRNVFSRIGGNCG